MYFKAQHFLITSLLSIIMTSCGSEQVVVQHKESTVYINPILFSLVEDFKKDCVRFGITSCEQKIHNLEYIDFRQSDTNSQIGTCEYVFENNGTVGLRVNIKQDMTNNQTKWTVYHELGHCALGYDHPSNLTSNSIMNASALPEVLYTDLQTWDFLVQDLFEGQYRISLTEEKIDAYYYETQTYLPSTKNVFETIVRSLHIEGTLPFLIDSRYSN